MNTTPGLERDRGRSLQSVLILEAFALADAKDLFDCGVALENALAAILEQRGHPLLLHGVLFDGGGRCAIDDHLPHRVVDREHLVQAAPAAEADAAAFGASCSGQ